VGRGGVLAAVVVSRDSACRGGGGVAPGFCSGGIGLDLVACGVCAVGRGGVRSAKGSYR